MGLPTLGYPPTTQNARVGNFQPGNGNSGRIWTSSQLLDHAEMDGLIQAAYSTLFFHTFRSDRDPFLESQLRNGQITVRDFIRGLALSERFSRWVYRCNSNYEVVTHLVQRLLGRGIYGEKERIALSIVVAQRGLAGFVDALLDSPEYLDNFGYDTVPYQRNRLLPSQAVGNVPFNIELPRYQAYWRDTLALRAPGSHAGAPLIPSRAWANGVPKLSTRLWYGLAIVGALEIGRVLLTTAAAMLSTSM